MVLTKIKNLFSRIAGQKKSRAHYLKSEMQQPTLPGKNNHQIGSSPAWKSRFIRLRKLFSGKKRIHHNEYKTHISRRKLLFKGAGLAVVSLSVLSFVLLGGWYTILNNFAKVPFFQVSGVVFTGADTISKDKLRDASGIVLHQTSLVGLDCARVEADLISVPWVAKAVVKRNWPSTVEIAIVENVPVALLHSNLSKGGQLQYIDRRGVPFYTVKPGADIDYPVITGLSDIDEPTMKKKALTEVLTFLDKVNGNNPQLPAQSVSEIHVNRSGEMVVYLVEHPFPIFFGSSNISKKYSRLVQVLKTLYKKQNGKGSIAEIEYIQMDYLNDKVLVAQNESS